VAVNNTDLQKWLWQVVDKLSANFALKSSEYSITAPGQLFIDQYANAPSNAHESQRWSIYV